MTRIDSISFFDPKARERINPKCPKCGSEMEYIGDAWVGGVKYSCTNCGYEEKVKEGKA